MKTKFTLLAAMLVAFFFTKAQQVPNGGFENWGTYAPTSWTTYEQLLSGLVSGFATKDTVDYVSGHASVKLRSDSVAFAPQQGVLSGIVSLGTGASIGGPPVYYGIAFPNRPDTLIFNYKYTTPGHDSGVAFIQMIKGLVDTVMYTKIYLDTTSHWKQMVLPLQARYRNAHVPDTLLMQFSSSAGGASVAVKNSTLHIDNVYFGYINFNDTSGHDTVITQIGDTIYTHIYDTITSHITHYDTTHVHDTVTTHIVFHDTIFTLDTIITHLNLYDTTFITFHDTTHTHIFDTTYHDTIVTHITVHDTSHLTIYDTITTHHTTYDTTQITIYDTSTTHFTVYDTITIQTVYDTINVPISVTDTLLINVDLTGVGGPNNTNTLKAYPNPAHNHLEINVGDISTMTGYSIKITDALGQQVYSSPINQQVFSLDLSTWGGNGTYILYILDTSQTIKSTKEIVLQ